MGAWKTVVNVLLPPPLLLTLLVLIPAPLVVRKGILLFVKKFLFLPVVGGIRLAIFALMITGISFAATSLQLYELYQRPMPDTLTPNQKIAIQARRWREERNWWIAALTFLLWGLLYRFYALMLDYVQLQEEHARLQRGSPSDAGRRPAPTSAAAPAPAPAAAPAPVSGKAGVEPSAPPLPTEPKKTK